MITGTFGRAAFTFGSISSRLMPSMLMSDRIRIRMGSAIVFARASASGADAANSMTKRPERMSRPELLAKKVLDVGFVIDQGVQFLCLSKHNLSMISIQIARPGAASLPPCAWRDDRGSLRVRHITDRLPRTRAKRCREYRPTARDRN